jgi:predicted esterase
MIDREVAAGIHPDNIFVCGFSQGGRNGALCWMFTMRAKFCALNYSI